MSEMARVNRFCPPVRMHFLLFPISFLDSTRRKKLADHPPKRRGMFTAIHVEIDANLLTPQINSEV